jgi:predicted MFS family arabinose efflux permease
MFLSMAAYAQQESTLVQYVTAAGTGGGIGIVTALIVTNGLTIVTFQFPLLRLLEGRPLFVRAGLGLVLFGLAFVAYAVLPIAHIIPWIVATWVFSVGEAVLFPTLQLQVDRSAPAALKGSYFGAASLNGLGFAFGPLLGGFLLEYAGGPATFLLTAASMTLCGACYWRASREPNAVIAL